MKTRLTVIAAALFVAGSPAHAADVAARERFPDGTIVNPCPMGFYWDGSKCVIKEIEKARIGAPQMGSDGVTGQQVGAQPGVAESARGIEKKDIRRGMVIDEPGSITPHARSGAPGGGRPIEDEAQGSPGPSQVTIKEKSSNVKTH